MASTACACFCMACAARLARTDGDARLRAARHVQCRGRAYDRNDQSGYRGGRLHGIARPRPPHLRLCRRRILLAQHPAMARDDGFPDANIGIAGCSTPRKLTFHLRSAQEVSVTAIEDIDVFGPLWDDAQTNVQHWDDDTDTFGLIVSTILGTVGLIAGRS